MNNSRLAFILFICTFLYGCATTSVSTYKAAGESKVCGNGYLGEVVVLPEAAWRENQKEPNKREIMALEEITSAFKSFPCGQISSKNGIKKFSNWSGSSESKLAKEFASEGVDTIIIIRIEELTPRIQISFSLPFLWRGANEADFRVRVFSAKTGDVLNDMRVKRLTGGPFNIRPAEWSRKELNSALAGIIGAYN